MFVIHKEIIFRWVLAMDIANPLYNNQGIHVDIATFTVENGIV